MNRAAIAIITLGALTIFLGMGVRQANGLFLSPVTSALGIGRETFSLAVALQNMIFGLPLLGILADRVGSRLVLIGGALLYATGLFLFGMVTTPSGLYLTLGLVIGLALSGVGYVVVLGAVAQVVPERRRTTVFGLITAAGSLGMFAIVPGAQWLLSSLGWQGAATGLSAVFVMVALLAFGFPGRSPRTSSPTAPEPLGESSLGQALLRASRHRGYWLLNMGFFVCGFHVSFVATHLPAFLTDSGMTAALGATALSLVGLFNLFGSMLAGWLGDRYRKKLLLSGLYLFRAVTISLFLLLPLSVPSALIFGAVIGFLWLATVPLTSGMVAQIFGSRFLSTLYGIVFLSHQLGAFLGVWLGGRVFDATGSYTSVWLLAVALGLAASLVHLPISDKRIRLVESAAD
ncbi:MAG: MFS transporter [Truepera sp.]|nr:MFS transporter [Truepera sp.]